MAYTKQEWKDLPDETTPFTAERMNHIEQGLADLYDAIFPIGQIVIKGDDADYTDWLGFTWIRTAQGKVLVGQDMEDSDFDTIGATGGSKEMQKHRHLVSNKYGNVNSGATWAAVSNLNNASAPSTSNIYTDYEGEGDSGNLQPYQVVAYWQRVQ